MLVDILAAILVGGPFLALVAFAWFRAPAPARSNDKGDDWSDVAIEVIVALLD